LLGTLRYMAPELTYEQIAIPSSRSDIYSLGVTLYELAVLRPAFDGENRQYLLKQIVLTDPPPLRRIDPTVPVDLAIIIQKAIAKDPVDRYATARDLGDDLKRFLQGFPIQAARPTLLNRTYKWARRHMALTFVALASLVLMSLLLAASTFVVMKLYESALAAAEELRQSLYVSEMNDMSESYQQANLRRAEMLLAQQLPRPGQTDYRGIEWYFWASQCQANRGIRLATNAKHANLRPDEKVFAALVDGELLEIDLVSSQRSLVFGRDRKSFGWPVYSPNGKHLAIRAKDCVHVMLTDSRETFRVECRGIDQSITFSPDGKLGASVSETGVQLWNADTGEIMSTLADDTNGAVRLSFSPDSRRLAILSALRNRIQFWNLADGACTSAPVRQANTSGVLFLDDDVVWVFGSEGIQMQPVPGCDPQRWRDLVIPTTREVRALDVNAAYTRIALGAEQNKIEVWDLANGELLFECIKPHRIETVRFLQNESQLFVFCDGVVELIPLTRQDSINQSPGEIRFEWCDCMSLWRDEMAVAGPNQDVVVWNVSEGTHRILSGLPPSDRSRIFSFLAHSPDGSRIAGALRDTAGVWVWDSVTGRLVDSISTPEFVYGLAYSPDGNHLAIGYAPFGDHLMNSELPCGLMLWDTRRAKTAWSQSLEYGAVTLRYSSDGKWLFAGGGPWFDGGEVLMWDLRDKHPVLAARFKQREIVLTLAVSDDDRWLAAGDYTGRICIYDTTNLTRATEFVAHSMAVNSLAFAPGGRTLVSGAEDGHVKFWQVDSWNQVADWPGSDPVQALRFVTTIPHKTGLIVGTRTAEDSPARVRITWMDGRQNADWSWLGADSQVQ
ncbi:MAG: hypothetical protein KDB23_15315, partial [Planctomycetales bacterium]|nr:hypothetical protein [Planctomycetales bacterium]